MPTIHVSGSPVPVPARRAAALRLTRWLSGHGVPAGHVVLRFTTTEPQSVFTGGLPAEALPSEGSGPQHLAVTVCVGPDRAEDFRTALAEEIAGALGASAATPFLYIEFRTTDPAQVYLGDSGRLRRAADVAARRKDRT